MNPMPTPAVVFFEIPVLDMGRAMCFYAYNYFATESIETTLQKVLMNGGQLHYPRTQNEFGFAAEFIDTEGNRIALFEQRQSEQT